MTNGLESMQIYAESVQIVINRNKFAQIIRENTKFCRQFNLVFFTLWNYCNIKLKINKKISN